MISTDADSEVLVTGELEYESSRSGSRRIRYSEEHSGQLGQALVVAVMHHGARQHGQSVGIIG